jgi:hypothetical protein
VAALPPGAPKALVVLDEILGELATVLPVGRGHFAAVGLQFVLEQVGVDAWNAILQRIQPRLAAKGITLG